MHGKKISLLLFLLVPFVADAQFIRLTGNAVDTVGPLPNVLMMAVKFNDSVLVDFSRSGKNGIFKPLRLKTDTYIVILSHPAFSDKTYLLVPTERDTVFNFRNVKMPPKSIMLREVEVIAHNEKSYYKGDTLIFTADSFKTAVNASVEDLLKKLPGVRVDAAGKITVQGRQVDQVLVDGDEFFGSDPTIATRNLNASSIENVQVYDKKNESTEEGANETLKVLNLKMKDGKKGYFGKVSGSSDFQKFYENELLANRFKGNQKISVFGLVANTPKQAFGGQDAYKFGLTGEQGWSYNDETGAWSNNNIPGTGIPFTLKSGYYFGDKFGTKTKVNSDYTLNQNELLTGSETNTQFFLQDTTYRNSRIRSSKSKTQAHNFNFHLIQKLDSLTELSVIPRIKYNNAESSNNQTDDFISGNEITTRRTTIVNNSKSENTDANILFKVTRNFLKKDRVLNVSYQPVYTSGRSNSFLNTSFYYYNQQANDSFLVQERTQDNLKVEHNAALSYTEPLTKKLKTELLYNYTSNHNTTNRNTYDLQDAGQDIFNPNLSNNFDNQRVINRAGTKLIYDVKKYRVVIGSYFRNIYQENLNVTTGSKSHLTVNNILPLATFNYRISQGSNFSFNYITSSQQPDLMQMQPVRDNSDPNRISIGNPDLRPTFTNNGSLNYYFYKGISDVNFWSGANFNSTNNQISYKTTYDEQGKAVTQPINVNGNYNTNLWLGGGFPILKKFLKVYYNFNGSRSNNVSYVNNVMNISQNSSFNPGLTLEKNVEKFNVRVAGDYSYNVPKSTISVRSNQPYYSYGLEGDVTVKLPKKFTVSTDGKYTNNGNRTPGYNLNYFILNASVSKMFLKSENLILSLNANDILNQNINNQRSISSNQIVDTKTQVIKRYFLIKLMYKFNSQNTKNDGDD
jgi:hypothetical protein